MRIFTVVKTACPKVLVDISRPRQTDQWLVLSGIARRVRVVCPGQHCVPPPFFFGMGNTFLPPPPFSPHPCSLGWATRCSLFCGWETFFVLFWGRERQHTQQSAPRVTKDLATPLLVLSPRFSTDSWRTEQWHLVDRYRMESIAADRKAVPAEDDSCFLED